jgi:hypothetical protein
MTRPITECVDYFSYPFDSLDMLATWRKATERAKSQCSKISLQGRRFALKENNSFFRRENAIWRRFFQLRGNGGKGLGKCDPRKLDWSRDKDIYYFYGPFYANATNQESSSSIHSRRGSESTSTLKPVLKKKIYPKDYIPDIKIKIDCNLRRICSETALSDPKRPRKDILLEKSPTTPKDIILQFFGDEKIESSSSSKVRFRPIVEHRYIGEDNPIVSAPSQDTFDPEVLSEPTLTDSLMALMASTNNNVSHVPTNLVAESNLEVLIASSESANKTALPILHESAQVLLSDATTLKLRSLLAQLQSRRRLSLNSNL